MVESYKKLYKTYLRVPSHKTIGTSGAALSEHAFFTPVVWIMTINWRELLGALFSLLSQRALRIANFDSSRGLPYPIIIGGATVGGPNAFASVEFTPLYHGIPTVCDAFETAFFGRIIVQEGLETIQQQYDSAWQVFACEKCDESLLD